jgi:hypothetical protein
MQDADPAALSRIGEVLLVAGGSVEVLWADGSRSAADPQQLFVVSGDDDMDGPVGTVFKCRCHSRLDTSVSGDECSRRYAYQSR